MRIVVESLVDDLFYVQTGITNVLRACGIEVIAWSPRAKPAFDLFDETNPDLLLASQPTLGSRPVAKCLRDYPRTQTGALAKSLVAADTIGFRGRRMDEHRSDLCYVGKYEAGPCDAYLLPLCDPKVGMDVKIYGDAPWPVAQYLGRPYIDTVPHLFASADLSLSFGDAESIYQILASGGLPVTTTPVPPPFDATNVLVAEAAADLTRKIKTATCKHFVALGMDVIRSGNTYWHRTATLLKEAGFTRESQRVMDVYTESR